MLAAATVVGLSTSVVAPAAIANDFRLTSGAPITSSIARASATATVSSGLSGVGRRKPKLSFDIHARGIHPITTVKVALPAGLAFSRHAADLRHGVRVRYATKSRTTVRRDVLAVTLEGASAHRVGLAVKGPALTESKSLVARIVKLVQYNQSHPAKRTLLLKLTVTVETGTAVAIRVPVAFTFR